VSSVEKLSTVTRIILLEVIKRKDVKEDPRFSNNVGGVMAVKYRLFL
jgi:hypothetical protein